MPEEGAVIIPGEENNFGADVQDTPTPSTTTADTTTDTTDNESTIQIGDDSYSLNEQGDAISEDGTIFKTKEEIDALESDDSDDSSDDDNKIDIEGVIYTIDEQGNALDDKGNVKYTKDEMSEMESGDDAQASFDIANVITTTNIPILDAEGNAVEYENTEEGISKYVNDVYQTAAERAVENEYKALYGKYPILQSVITHVMANGGKLDGFNDRVDYSAISLDKENKDQLKSIILTARTNRGDSDEQANNYYTYLTDSDSDGDKVLREAEAELKYLNDYNAKLDADNQAKIDAQRSKDIDDANNYWGVKVDDKGQLVNLNVQDSIYSTITTGKLKIDGKDYTIPEKIRVTENGKVNYYNRADFFNYLYVPKTVNIDGQTAELTGDQYKIRMEDNKRSTSDDIFDAFKRFVNYDTSQFITEKINKDKTNTIKKLKIKRKQGNDVAARTSGKKQIIIP